MAAELLRPARDGGVFLCLECVYSTPLVYSSCSPCFSLRAWRAHPRRMLFQFPIISSGCIYLTALSSTLYSDRLIRTRPHTRKWSAMRAPVIRHFGPDTI